MFNRLRTNRWMVAAAVVLALSLTVYAVAQKKAASAAAGTSNVVAATVDGEKITRGYVVDELLKNQAANISALEPKYVDKARPLAASVGAVVIKKMSANGWGAATITRGEIVDWLFKDKPDILIRTVERMITERAVAHAAQKQGITLTQADIDAQTAKSIEVARKNYHLEGKTDNQVLASLGVRRDYLTPFVKTQLFLERMILKDIEKKLGHAPGPQDFVEASHILVMVRPTAADEASKEKAFEEGKKKITDIAEEIKSGKKTFAQAAQAYSDDGTKFKEGKLGLFTRGQMVPEFEQAAFSQPKGKVGDPVRTQYGWHLIRVDKQGSETTGPERKQVMDQLVQQRVQAKVKEIMDAAKVVNTVPPPPAPAPMMMPQGGQ